MPHHNIYEGTDRRRMVELLDEIQKSKTALPEFQRDFVWRPVATQKLLVSVVNNFPIGSLLRLRIQSSVAPLFEPRCFQDAPAINPLDLDFLVLDGQQRLTSLYSAFYGLGKHRYFIDLNWFLADKERMAGKALLDVEDECVFFEEVNSKREKELQVETNQAAELVFPLSNVFGGKGFSHWMLNVVGTSDPKMLNELNAINNEWMEPVKSYEIPVITHPQTTPIEAVCVIFETLNKTHYFRFANSTTLSQWNQTA